MVSAPQLPRERLPELMDQEGLAPAAHRCALAGLGRINAVSGSARLLWPAVAELCRTDPTRQWRLLDVATGGGDVPLALARRAARRGWRLSIGAVDFSPTALSVADARAGRLGLPLETILLRIGRDRLPRGYDLVTCSLFLHHLAELEAVALLRELAAVAPRVLVNDLLRSRAGSALAWAGTRLLSRSDIVRTDGPRSVAAAFTVAEARALAVAAGLEGAVVTPRFPYRWLMTWRAP